MAAIPPLSLTGGGAGPATGQAASDGTSSTGDLIFKGSSSRENSTGWIQALAPILIGVVALWAIVKR